ncbi:hypothetical protein [Pontibacter cellulosilyticus]|uniref:Uncharacterized protein n=1 Tax=Pontibacter cellulosilyticus TaxID=1720253 RepID=A0A923N3K6_9BACT|nr:hypothetical protein [Pontibacter cellulosilyticus]MBC5991608.1 hypothetical protein [Pontibacter cellulosilyticus]
MVGTGQEKLIFHKLASVFIRAIKKISRVSTTMYLYLKYRFYLYGLERQSFSNKNVVLFFMHPDEDVKAGGILSIYFIIDKSEKILEDAVVLPVTLSKLPGYTRVAWFENKWFIYNLYYINKSLQKADTILLHVPEVFFNLFCELIKEHQLFELAKKIRVNILNQNEQLIPSKALIEANKRMFCSLTMTLAFEANTKNIYEYLDKKPYFISAWFYSYTVENSCYEEKENICIISPDPNPYKMEIVKMLNDELRLQCIEVTNMAFSDFQLLQKRAKWSISFGEGFDNYFAGAFVKSGVGFSVYNSIFFPKSFDSGSLPETIFVTYEDMRENIVKAIKSLDNKTSYEKYVTQVKPLILEHSSPEKVEEALKHFYANEIS